MCSAGSDGKASVYNAGDPDSIPGLGRSPGEGNGNLSTIAWKIPWTEEPGRLQSMGSQTTESGGQSIGASASVFPVNIHG